MTLGIPDDELPMQQKEAEDAQPDPLSEIKNNLLTQDNRCTADPMFCVQVCERIGPIMLDYGSGNICFFDHDECECFYEDGFDKEEWARLKALHDEGSLPDNITASSFVEKWETVQVCFTEEGCKRHLDLNGHNYRSYFGTRIYAESFYRNPEMLAIRKSLMAKPD